MVAKIAPLIVVVGETASGKTALGVELAKKFNGEIICADSRTIYKGMDIGTAKPTNQEQKAAKHHLLDVIEPNETYSAAQFKHDALKLIDDINARGKLPIIVGGTGLYVDSVLFDYQFAPLGAARNPKNPRHLAASEQRPHAEIRPNTLVIGLQRDRDDLRKRIEKRVDVMLRRGFIDEVKRLGEQYGYETEALSGIGYRYFAQHVQGQLPLEDAKQKFINGDMLLAKRQRTWFKRNKSIQWANNSSEAVDLATTFLNNLGV
jgi:tRNA dimethylallyltransferase